MVYVSDSVGDDSNDGLSINTPRKSLVSGYLLLRDKFPDWLLLKRGDRFLNQTIGNANKQWILRGSGVGLEMVISGYGTGPRPLIVPSGQNGFYRTGGGGAPPTVDHVAIVGLEFCAYRDAQDTSSAIFLLGSGTNWLIEGCRMSGFAGGITAQNDVRDLRARRNIIVDMYGANQHPQGTYINHCSGILYEENILDANGYHPDYYIQGTPTGTNATIFNHNAYIGTDNKNVTFKNNVFSRGSSHGLQLRCGGLVQGNLFIKNALNLLIGGGDPDVSTHVSGITGSGIYNVIWGGKDINGANRSDGITLTNIGLLGAYIYNNIISTVNSTGSQGSISLSSQGYGAGVGANNIVVDSNVIYNWNQDFSINASTPTGAYPSAFNSSTGNKVSNNFFQEPYMSGDYLVTVISSGQGSWSNNKFASVRSTGTWFLVNGVTKTFGQFQPLVQDTTSTTGFQNFPFPDRSPASYALSINSSGSTEGFIALLRSQEYMSWNDSLKTVNLVNYFRAGFGLSNYNG